MKQKYSYKNYEKATMARALAKDQSVSLKHCKEIANFIRGKKTKTSKKFLENVIEMKQAVPFKIHNADVGHKSGKMGAGRYPINAAKVVLSLLNLVMKNADYKGLDGEEAKIIHINAHKASSPYRYGRHRGRESKRTHIEIIIQSKKSEKKKTKKKAVKKTEKKSENKLEKKEEKKSKPKKTEKEKKKEESKKENKKSKESNQKTEKKTEKPKTKEGNKE